MDGLEKFEEARLPPKDVFYSRLNMKDISDQDYKHAQQVWNRITPGHKNITLGDYHDIYLETDVLLLSENTTGWIQFVFTPHQVWHGRPY